MNQAPSGTYTSTIIALFEKGVRYSTVIDVGCADGHFFLTHMDYLPGATVVNIDADSTYEPSLKAIRRAIGGHFVVAALGDREGEVTMTSGAHPYWNSLRAKEDRYWERLNQLHQGERTVKMVTLDSVANRLQLAPPYLIKLDVQGAEAQVLRGASGVLSETHTVICEVDLDDHAEIHRILDEAGFGLFDLTTLNWLPDRTLGWFYPVYLNRKLDTIRRRAFWDKGLDARAIAGQAERRKRILRENAAILERLRAKRGSRPPR